MAEALYRKYRPKIFEDVVGQEHIERTIKNAIEQDKLSHAYLFTGPRGTGKTTTARLLAKALLCQKGPTSEPDGTCEDCEAIARGEHPDVYELDAASRTGVENVREEIIGRVQFAPTRGRYKVYIIDEVHMLSTAAFNALLKTLEEPPSHVVFVLATTDPQKVPETIHSRCQRFDFRRISTEAIVSRLGAICVAEGVDFEGEALELVAHRAEGGMRNALTSLEQLIAFGEGKVSVEVAEHMLGTLDSGDLAEIVRLVGTRDAAACFRWTAAFVETGADLAQFTRDFAEHIRNLYVMSLAGAEMALDVSAAARREMTEELALYGPERLARLLGVLGDLSSELKTSTNPRLSFEIALTRMLRPESELTLEALAERIEDLERGAAGFAGAGAAPVREAAFVAPLPADVERRLERLEKAVGGAPFGGGEVVASAVVAAVPAAASAVVAPAASSAPAGSGLAKTSAEAASRMLSGPTVLRRAEEARELPSHQEAAVSSAEARAGQGSRKESAAQPVVPREELREEPRPAAAASGDLPERLLANLRNAAALQRLWQQAMAQLKKAKAAYGVLFLNTRAVFEEAGAGLAIDFPAENDFAFKAVQKPDVQDELARAILQAFGHPLPFRLTKGGFAAGGAVASATPAASSAPRVKQAQARQAQDRQMQPGSGQGARVSAGQQPEGRSPELAHAAGPRGAERRPAQEPSGAVASSPSSAVARGCEASSSAVAAGVAAAVAAHDAASRAYDEVPLEAYDDVVPYDDEPYAPYEEAAFASSAQDASFAPAQEAVRVPLQEEADVSDREEAGSAQPDADPSLSDLDAMLAFGFGEGVGFSEV